ncbi:tyrosine recombinase XerA [Chloroflexota bacterium]
MQLDHTPFNDWLTCQYPHSSARKHIISDLALFFSWAGKPPSEISPQDVNQYIHHCLEKSLSPLTINRRLSSLRLIYYFLRIIQEEPLDCPVQKRHFLRKPQPLPRDANEEQIAALFSVITNKRDKAIFTLMLEYGLRVGEVCALSLDDVLLEDPPRLKIHGKGGRQRITYLPPPAIPILTDWLTSRPVTKDRAVFISQRGKRLSVNGIQFILKEYCQKAGVQVTCHQFRHAFRRRMAEASMPVTSLQKLLGYRSPRITQRYINLSNPVLQADYDHAIQKALGGMS